MAGPLPLTVIGSADVDGSRFGNGVVVSTAASVTPSGGTVAYSYSWAHVSGDTMTINSPGSSSTTFQKFLVAPATASGIFRCTITDGVGRTVTDDVSVFLEAI